MCCMTTRSTASINSSPTFTFIDLVNAFEAACRFRDRASASLGAELPAKLTTVASGGGDLSYARPVSAVERGMIEAVLGESLPHLLRHQIQSPNTDIVIGDTRAAPSTARVATPKHAAEAGFVLVPELTFSARGAPVSQRNGTPEPQVKLEFAFAIYANYGQEWFLDRQSGLVQGPQQLVRVAGSIASFAPKGGTSLSSVEPAKLVFTREDDQLSLSMWQPPNQRWPFTGVIASCAGLNIQHSTLYTYLLKDLDGRKLFRAGPKAEFFMNFEREDPSAEAAAFRR
jgi:hypothetical protein